MTLTLEHVAVARGGLRLLEGVSFTVDAGQTLTLRGPNGIGKTSLLRAVAGLQPAAEGQIDGAADRVAYASHADGLKATLTVEENLTFWARLYRSDKVTHAMDAFDLTRLSDRAAQNLSAGQKRRLGLARLLVTDRPLWVLDEPTVSLDTQAVAQFAEVLDRHVAGGGQALLATHIPLGIDGAELDLTAYKATRQIDPAFDEAFS